MKQAPSLGFCIYWICLSTNQSSSVSFHCRAPQIIEKPNRKEQLPRTYAPKTGAIFHHLLLFQWVVASLPKFPTITLVWHFDSCSPLQLSGEYQLDKTKGEKVMKSQLRWLCHCKLFFPTTMSKGMLLVEVPTLFWFYFAQCEDSQSPEDQVIVFQDQQQSFF